jgi:hypothetical protein
VTKLKELHHEEVSKPLSKSAQDFTESSKRIEMGNNVGQLDYPLRETLREGASTLQVSSQAFPEDLKVKGQERLCTE